MGTLEYLLEKAMQIYARVHACLHDVLIFYKWCSVRLPAPRGEVSRALRQPQVWACRLGQLGESCPGCQEPLSYSHLRQRAMSRAGGQRTSPQHSRVLLPPGRKQHPHGKEVKGRTRSPSPKAPSFPLAKPFSKKH